MYSLIRVKVWWVSSCLYAYATLYHMPLLHPYSLSFVHSFVHSCIRSVRSIVSSYSHPHSRPFYCHYASCIWMCMSMSMLRHIHEEIYVCVIVATTSNGICMHACVCTYLHIPYTDCPMWYNVILICNMITLVHIEPGSIYLIDLIDLTNLFSRVHHTNTLHPQLYY